jgi:hypothetical protein
MSYTESFVYPAQYAKIKSYVLIKKKKGGDKEILDFSDFQDFSGFVWI